ncbi:uncharacterized protein LOC121419796 [Lytechinus variegatus]|uniref:uncharacterized protein LOC121419796 n=1 Tax=Lytechinus variegatus TaxID=7654 RepID=UPI001BB1041F|nr:uncharacterized protein LOC121419796 [Lytechinus variegatus]
MSILVLVCSVRSGMGRTCLTCKDVTSDDFDMELGGSEYESCTDNPGDMECPDGISTCMTGVIIVRYGLESGQNVTFRDEKRACAPEEILASISPGDQCLNRSVIDSYFSANDPAELYPNDGGMTFHGIVNATFCVCDSSDRCTPPSPDGEGPPRGSTDTIDTVTQRQVTSARSGMGRTCLTCKEVTSDDIDMELGESEYESCIDNPGDMECPDDISTCMTGVINVRYYNRETSQNVTFRDEKRACAPEEVVGSIPSGDHCVDQTVVESYFSTNDPAELYSDMGIMEFRGIVDATFCVCDSGDRCTPPSPSDGQNEGSMGQGMGRTCLTCKEVTSDDIDMELGESEYESCTDNPGDMECPDGISTCMTGVINVRYYNIETGQNVTFRDEKRACAPEEVVGSTPSGDHCVDQTVVESYFSTNDPAELYPDMGIMEFRGIVDATFCVCDSGDKCTPPSPSDGLNEGSRGQGEGDPRICIECKEVTSTGDVIHPGETDIVSCSDNPDEMVCSDGISTCMTGIVNVLYVLESGHTITVTDKRRACAPPDVVASSPSGDVCAPKSVVEDYFSDNPPDELYPNTEEMTFYGILNATFCLCDSADRCTPPSPEARHVSGGSGSRIGATTPKSSSRSLKASEVVAFPFIVVILLSVLG